MIAELTDIRKNGRIAYTSPLRVHTPTPKSMGDEMYAFICELFPICRSITGEGVTDTLNIIQKHVPLTIHHVPSGTKVFDWEIPLEWNIRAAHITDSKGRRVVDFADNNLHVLNYSAPIHRNVSLAELREHLYTLPETPDWIPYRTSYYKEQWGFCVSYNQYQQLQDDRYEIHIDSTLGHGNLTYAECFIPGQLKDEVLISTHICHPSLCNDNLSGIAVATFLAKQLLEKKPRYSYRFVFVPGTIGAIAWLAANEKHLVNIKHGLVASLLGDEGAFIYKKSRRGNAEIDDIVGSVLKSRYVNHKIIEFNPFGYDERQYCSPGFNLPVGCLSRSLPGQYPEYHTSADNPELVKPKALEESLRLFSEIVRVLEANRKHVSLNQKCEPQLSRRNLYHTVGGTVNKEGLHQAIIWTLNLADGTHSVLDICRRSGLETELVIQACELLTQVGLLTDNDGVNDLIVTETRKEG